MRNLGAALPVLGGGTGGTTAAAARSAISAAASGANSDITSLAGLTTPLSVGQGGTGNTTAPGFRSSFQVAVSGSNNDITSLSALTTAISVAQGGTGSTTASAARAALSAAGSGANTDITSLGGLTTPLSVAQGGTGDAGTSASPTFTPTVTTQTGSITTLGTLTNQGHYRKLGRQVWVNVTVPITTNGTGAGYVAVTNIPFTAAFTSSLVGTDTALTGKGLTAFITGTTLYIRFADGTYPGANGCSLTVSGWFESTT